MDNQKRRWFAQVRRKEVPGVPLSRRWDKVYDEHNSKEEAQKNNQGLFDAFAEDPEYELRIHSRLV